VQKMTDSAWERWTARGGCRRPRDCHCSRHCPRHAAGGGAPTRAIGSQSLYTLALCCGMGREVGKLLWEQRSSADEGGGGADGRQAVWEGGVGFLGDAEDRDENERKRT
jgi:hypothetical protein